MTIKKIKDLLREKKRNPLWLYDLITEMSSFARFNLIQYLIALSHTVCVESLELLILTFLISCFSYMKRICKSFENVEKNIREIIAIRKISWTLVANFCLPLQRLSNLISIHKNYIIISLFMLFFQFILFESSVMYIYSILKIFVVGCGDLVFSIFTRFVLWLSSRLSHA